MDWLLLTRRELIARLEKGNSRTGHAEIGVSGNTAYLCIGGDQIGPFLMRPTTPPPKNRSAGLVVDLPAGKIHVMGGVDLELGPMQYKMLLRLMRARGSIVTRKQFERLWGPRGVKNQRLIDRHLSNLREKLKDAGSTSKIVAVKNRGYRLVNK